MSGSDSLITTGLQSSSVPPASPTVPWVGGWRVACWMGWEWGWVAGVAGMTLRISDDFWIIFEDSRRKTQQ